MHISATQIAKLAFHCEHPGNLRSYRLPGDELIVYVTGTPEELFQAATALLQAASIATYNNGKETP